jgi:hypothetical protein
VLIQFPGNIPNQEFKILSIQEAAFSSLALKTVDE